MRHVCVRMHLYAAFESLVSCCLGAQSNRYATQHKEHRIVGDDIWSRRMTQPTDIRGRVPDAIRFNFECVFSDRIGYDKSHLQRIPLITLQGKCFVAVSMELDPDEHNHLLRYCICTVVIHGNIIDRMGHNICPCM